MTDENTTHFGYKTVESSRKSGMVADVFDSVAAKYDIMNDVMSLGVHRIWKQITIDQSGVRPGQHVLDLAGGTGDLAIKLSKRVGPKGSVVLSDINESMLSVARDRLTDKGIVGNVQYSQADAEELPFDDNCFHCVTMAFGLRNVTDKDKALASIFRVLRPGGRLLVLEFSKPVLPLLSKAYDAYSFTALPAMGKLIAGDSESYRYCLLYTSPSPRDGLLSRMPSSA